MAGSVTRQPGGAPIACDFVSGALFSNAQRQDLWQQAGIDGYGAHILGKGDSQFDFRLVKYSVDAAATEAWKASLYALKDALVTVVDDRNVNYPNLLIVEFSRPVQNTIFKDGASVKSERCELVISGVAAVVA